MRVQAEADLAEAKAAVSQKIEEAASAARQPVQDMYIQADEEIMKMTDALYDKVNTVSAQTSAAITEQAERESAQLKEFYGYIDSRLEQIEASTPAPVVLQATEEPTDSASEEETQTDAELALERAREVLAEKAMVYADLKAQYNAAV